MENLQRVRKELAASLRKNYHYAHAINMRQIDPLRLFVIDSGGVETYFRRLTESGTKTGDVKTEVVSPLSDWSTWFRGSFTASSR